MTIPVLLVRFTLYALLIGVAASYASAADSQQRAARNTLQAVDYALLPAGGLFIKVVFRDALKTAPAVLVSHYPVYRISIDFPDTVSAAGKQPFEVAQGGLRSFQVAQAGDRTRLVLNLDRPFIYEAVVKGNELLITLQRRQPSAAREVSAWSRQAVLDAPLRTLRDVAFQPGAAGAGRILIEVSHASVPVDVRRQGNTLILDFLHAQLPRELVRRLDVGDFGTPIRAIETYPVGSHARMTVELAGADEIVVYQINRQLILSSH
jgi:type IV pilus assembly protein PilQ